MTNQNEDVAVQCAPAGGAEHFGADVWAKLLLFAKLLEDEGQLRGLVGPREMARLWDRHILNSLPICEYLDKNSSLSDVGSGAGFPGVVIAVVRPDVKVYLIETMERRVDWLRYVVEKLELRNVEIIHSRAEELVGKHATDYVTARAVAALKKLIPWTLPLTKPGGSLLALKGGKAEQEIDDAIPYLKKYKVKWADVHDVPVWGCDEGTRVVELRKHAS
ncbi:16S rRNA (guanine527-N7)-methyltransferase [Arcanobacterium pluranimalium]|uniref:16S rRNA (guanine(527)-N(7))-methyltransferase RsmG n=1 Tax=Arcanobacterium pluranimalium TaxID=108028 RepID=UPI001956478C|nr:16S rRNA (guanine(527)-N(7))-methyltransferase RsmG [Arcanobacterium pluranimalium]MBM7824447.1 16S rRNA (guanine527-N7)-methyltransferase [Arcanobacterium pluranimalium]